MKSPTLLPSNIWSDDLDEAYAQLVASYAELHRTDTFFNALADARAYLRKWPAPYEIPGRAGVWFTGDKENIPRRKNGEQLLGCEVIPAIAICACLLYHPFKRGKNLPTCVHREIVILWKQAKDHEQLCRDIHGTGLSCSDPEGVPGTAPKRALHEVT